MKLLDRYVLRTFLHAYAYCIAAFVSIWLIFDISDNLSTFVDDRVSLALVTRYYLTQLPQILVFLLPVALLLALLFSLGRMSRTNELVSMLTAGVSIPRLILPLVGIGLLTTIASGALNFSLAPKAEEVRRTFFDEARDTGREPGIVGQIFRNRAEARTWFIQHFRPEKNEFITVQVLQQDENENVHKNYMATRAYYHPDKKAWELQLAKVVTYDATGNIIDTLSAESLLMSEWSETPFRLASSTMRAENLSLSELRDYVHFNGDFPPSLLAPFTTHLQYRVALPWMCLIVVFLAAPLAIVFSRRGILSSVATAIGLVFSMYFLRDLFLALGEGNRIAPWLAAWGTNIIFATIGALLLYIRATNRDWRSLNPFASSRAAA